MTKEIRCTYCKSSENKKKGRYKDRVQRYICNECGTQFRGEDRESDKGYLYHKKMEKDPNKSIFWNEDE